MMNHYIDYIVRHYISKRRDRNNKIGIYPFGKVGQKAKRYFEDVYGLHVDYIFDNALCKYNSNIYDMRDQGKGFFDNIDIFICSDNPEIYDEVRETVRLHFDEEHIYDLFQKVRLQQDTRIETLRLNAERIKELGLGGSVAELGVYEGGFSYYINKYFSDKNLYLFDTFEGFTNEHLRENVEGEFGIMLEAGGHYCVPKKPIEQIIQGFPSPPNVKIMRGYFPETVKNLDERFCFVSLDVDIYQSTKDGLEYFYPRLERNGMIMVHDYNLYGTEGVKRAVCEFAETNKIPFVMVADEFGSVIISKF